MDNMNPAPGAGKVIRAPSLKRGRNDETRISDRVSALLYFMVLFFHGYNKGKDQRYCD
jgi:hypothetical protein